MSELSQKPPALRILTGDCRVVLASLPAESVQCVVTSPPYYLLRDYGTGTWNGGDPACDHGVAYRERRNSARQAGVNGGVPGSERDRPKSWCRCGAQRIDNQIGLEQSPDAYVAAMVEVFWGVKRVLRGDGTCWLNVGDSYVSGPTGSLGTKIALGGGQANQAAALSRPDKTACGKPKDLLGIPWRVAFALQADGWYLRSAIVWQKPNPMPESVTDRPTSSYEMVFMLAKNERYFYDADAIAEEAARPGDVQTIGSAKGRAYKPEKTDPNFRNGSEQWGRSVAVGSTRNARNVWTIATRGEGIGHYGLMPPDLAERCIKAGSRPGDTILDPFAGAGTTLLVADRLQRSAIGIELNLEYAALARQRIEGDCPMFSSVT